MPLTVIQPNHEISYRADFLTLGGGAVLALTITLTLVLLMSLWYGVVNTLQFAIIVLLTIACWLYMMRVSTERIVLASNELKYGHIMGWRKQINVAKIVSYQLYTYGPSLNLDWYELELVLDDDGKKMLIGLGPCFNRNELVAFCKFLDAKLSES